MASSTSLYSNRFLGMFAKLQKATISFVMSVHLDGRMWLSLDGLSWDLIFEYFFKSVKHIHVSVKSDRNNRYFTWSLRTLMTISPTSQKRNVSDKSCRENQNTHFMFSNFFPKIVLFTRLLKKYCTVEQTTDDNIIWGMHFACWITKATNTHSEYAILIAFVWEQWLHEHTSVLHHVNIQCLSCSSSVY